MTKFRRTKKTLEERLRNLHKCSSRAFDSTLCTSTADFSRTLTPAIKGHDCFIKVAIIEQLFIFWNPVIKRTCVAYYMTIIIYKVGRTTRAFVNIMNVLISKSFSYSMSNESYYKRFDILKVTVSLCVLLKPRSQKNFIIYKDY